MSAQQHRHQQIHRSKQGNGAREESQGEADRANELDRPGECDLHGRQRHAQAGKIQRVDLELKGPAEDVTSEMRDEHQPDIDSNERQCQRIERYFSRIRRCCGGCGPQDKMDEHKSAEKPTQKLEARHARARRDLQVEILSAQTGDAGRGVQTQNAEQARNHGSGQRRRRNGREGAT